MNIIDTVKKVLFEYDKIDEFSNGVHIDFTDNKTENIGLSSNGDTFIKEDLLGNQKLRHNFVMYAVNQATSDYDRLKNSNFLLELGYYLRTIKDIEITANIKGVEKKGALTKLSCSNAMLYSVLDGDLNNNVMYQIQIYAEYTIYEEE